MTADNKDLIGLIAQKDASFHHLPLNKRLSNNAIVYESKQERPAILSQTQQQFFNTPARQHDTLQQSSFLKDS